MGRRSTIALLLLSVLAALIIFAATQARGVLRFEPRGKLRTIEFIAPASFRPPTRFVVHSDGRRVAHSTPGELVLTAEQTFWRSVGPDGAEHGTLQEELEGVVARWIDSHPHVRPVGADEPSRIVIGVGAVYVRSLEPFRFRPLALEFGSTDAPDAVAAAARLDAELEDHLRSACEEAFSRWELRRGDAIAHENALLAEVWDLERRITERTGGALRFVTTPDPATAPAPSRAIELPHGVRGWEVPVRFPSALRLATLEDRLARLRPLLSVVEPAIGRSRRWVLCARDEELPAEGSTDEFGPRVLLPARPLPDAESALSWLDSADRTIAARSILTTTCRELAAASGIRWCFDPGVIIDGSRDFGGYEEIAERLITLDRALVEADAFGPPVVLYDDIDWREWFVELRRPGSPIAIARIRVDAPLPPETLASFIACATPDIPIRRSVSPTDPEAGALGDAAIDALLRREGELWRAGVSEIGIVRGGVQVLRGDEIVGTVAVQPVDRLVERVLTVIESGTSSSR